MGVYEHLIKFRYNHEFPTIVLWVDLSSFCSRSFSPSLNGSIIISVVSDVWSLLSSHISLERGVAWLWSGLAWFGFAFRSVWICAVFCRTHAVLWLLWSRCLSVYWLLLTHLHSGLLCVQIWSSIRQRERKQQQQYCSTKCLRSARSSFEEGNNRCVFSLQKLKLKFVFKSSDHRGV